MVSEYLASKKDETEWQEKDKNKLKGKRIIVCELSQSLWCLSDLSLINNHALPGLVYNSLIHSWCWNLIDVTRADDHACLVLKLVAKNREKLLNKSSRIGKNSLVCVPQKKVLVSVSENVLPENSFGIWFGKKALVKVWENSVSEKTISLRKKSWVCSKFQTNCGQSDGGKED